MNFEKNYIDYKDTTIRYEAVLYPRVSDPKQVSKGGGLRSQEVRGREYAKFLGIPVAKVFREEGWSGKLLDRPEMIRLLEFISQPPAGVRYVVIVDEISRLARSYRVHFDLRDTIEKHGALLASPSTTFKAIRDADSDFVEGIQALGAEHFRRKGAETSRNRKWGRIMDGYWPYQPAVGYKFVMSKAHGNLLVRNEPIASILQEALEGFATGRFASQAEMKRFLESHPEFPYRSPDGTIRHQRIVELLKKPIYAGYVQCKSLKVSLREGKHEPLISWSVYEKNQKRICSKAMAPARKDIHLDFPLRGFVLCGGCEKPLRASWSKSRSGKLHPYYLCQTKSCDHYGKSIKQTHIEGEFDTLIRGLRPTVQLFQLVNAMIMNAWDQRIAQAETMRSSLKKKLRKLDKDIETFLDRLADASSTTAKAYERRIDKLEFEKVSVSERLENLGKSKHPKKQLLEPCLRFLSNPWKLWDSGDIHLQRLLLRLVFREPLVYCRNEGYRTAKTTMPFNMLGAFSGGDCLMVPPAGLEPANPIG